MGRHEHRRSIWLITPLLFFAFMAIVLGSTSLRADHSADKFSGPTAITDATVLRYEEPSLTSQIFSKFAEGTFLVRFRVDTGDEVEAKAHAALIGPPEPVGAVLRVEYVQADPTTARLLRGAHAAREDARFYGGLALLSVVVVAALTAVELLSRRPQTPGRCR